MIDLFEFFMIYLFKFFRIYPLEFSFGAAPYVIIFDRFDIILKNSIILFYLFVCFLLNFIIFYS